MTMDWVDASMPLEPGITVWPGDAPFEFSPAGRISLGGSSNTSRLSLSTHTGTHVDAPWHYEADGKRLDEVDSAVFFGNASLLDFTGTRRITADALKGRRILPRVLFRTSASDRPHTAPFDEEFPSLTCDAAEWLVEQGVRLVGIDSPSVGMFKEPGRSTHHILLRNEVFIVENLRLAGMAEGVYPFVVLPLPVVGADGGPCRAFIGPGGAGA